MTKKFILGGFSVVAIAGCLFFLVYHPAGKGEKVARNASEALGQRAAEEVAQLVGNTGQIAVLAPEIARGQAPTFVAQMEVFTSTLKKHGVTISSTKLLPGGLTSLVLGGGASAKDYLSLLEQVPDAKAVVSFAGPPGGSPGELQKLQSGRPPLVVVDTFGTSKGRLPACVEAGAVALGILPYDSVEAEKEKQQPKLFDRYYRILRAPAQNR